MSTETIINSAYAAFLILVCAVPAAAILFGDLDGDGGTSC